MSIVHLIRHGQVDNPTGILYERLPGYHLTKLGQEMAETVAAHFADTPITHLRCSPLERAQETMAPIAARFPNLEVQIDPQVTEAASRFAGQVMGSSAKAARYPRNWHLLTNPFRPSWGEQYQAIATRMIQAAQEAALQVGEGGQAIIVSHQLPIWTARRQASNQPLWHDPRHRQCTLASVTTFHLEADAITKITYTEPAAHLLPNRNPGF